MVLSDIYISMLRWNCWKNVFSFKCVKLTLKHANKHSKINKQTNSFFVYSTLEKIAKMQNCNIAKLQDQIKKNCKCGWCLSKNLTPRKSLSSFKLLPALFQPSWMWNCFRIACSDKKHFLFIEIPYFSRNISFSWSIDRKTYLIRLTASPISKIYFFAKF